MKNQNACTDNFQISKRNVTKRVTVFAAVTLSLLMLFVGLISCKKKTGDETTTVVPTTDVVSTVAADGYISLSGIAMSSDGAYAYVSDETCLAIYKIDVATHGIAAVYESEVAVHNVVVVGDTVYALEGALGGKLVVLDSNLVVQGSVVTGHTPYDVVVNGTIAYVANRFSNTVSVVDLSTMTETAEIEVAREPESMVLVGEQLFVAGHLPDDAACGDVVAADISVVSTATNTVTATIELVNGAGSVKDIVASPDGSTLYVSHIIARYQYPTTQLDAGWINTNGISVIDVASLSTSYTFLLDELENGAGNPWGLALSDDGSKLYCAISGTDELMKVNLTALDKLVKRVGTTAGSVDTLDDIVNYIPFAESAKERIDLGGIGVRAIAFCDSKIYAAEYFTGEVKVVDCDAMEVTDAISIAQQPEIDAVRLGEIYWYDATICYQNWQSCNSCHPDARVDGFNWDNLNDGLGASKQARSMLYSHRTPPVMITGIRANAETAVAAGLKYICFNANTAGVIESIDEYLKSMEPVQSPYLNDDGTLTELAEKGKALFEQYDCAECHPAPLYTDLKMHLSADLKVGTDWEYREFVTPTLVEVWRTAPWAFNGYFTDMTEYIKFMVTEGGHGSGTISDDDAKALAEYVLSIGAEGETYGVEQIFNSDASYNKIAAGTTITSLTVRQQLATTTDAVVTITLYDASGSSIGSATGNVAASSDGTLTKITFATAISVPSDISSGAYYVITIKDASGNSLATDLKILY